MMRLWERVFRRTDLPVTYTQGFNPHIKFSLAVPLSVGMTSAAEYCELFLDTLMKPLELQERLAKELPEGLSVMDVRLSPYRGSPAAQVALIEYEVTCFGDTGSKADLGTKIRTVLDAAELRYMKTNKNGTKQIDLRPFIQDLSLLDHSPQRTRLQLQIKTGPSGSIKPEDVLHAAGIVCDRIKLHRREMYFKTARGEYFIP